MNTEKDSIIYITTMLLNGVETAKALGVSCGSISQYRSNDKHLNSSELNKISSYLKSKRNKAKIFQAEVDAFDKFLTKKLWEERGEKPQIKNLKN